MGGHCQPLVCRSKGSQVCGFNVLLPQLSLRGSPYWSLRGGKGLVPHSGCLHRPRRLPDIVFSDLASLPIGPETAKYWGAWTTTLLFYCLGANNSVVTPTRVSNEQGSPLFWVPPPPPGMDGSLGLPRP
jgi:hypothetical protein